MRSHLFLVVVAVCTLEAKVSILDLFRECDDVAIVGAGPAGTYAAFRLRDKKKKITLYEYSDRVGGRLNTMTLGGARDVKVEMGGMRFVNSVHSKMGSLVRELGLTAKEFVEGFGHAHRMRYYFRNTSLTVADLTWDKLPFQLSEEEKPHAKDLLSYYVGKLTGKQQPTPDNILTLTTPDGGRLLYQLRFTEALELAGASQEAIALMMRLYGFSTEFTHDISFACVLHDIVSFESANDAVLTVHEGLSAVPQAMHKEFLKTSWLSHEYKNNHRLMGIERRAKGGYELHFEQTKTKNGVTIGTGQAVMSCAKKVILAVPHVALSRIFWKPFQEDPNVRDSLDAVIPAFASKFALVYPHAFWESAVRNATVLKTDLLERTSYDFGDSVTGNSVIIVSYTDGEDVAAWRRLQRQGTPIPGSLPGDHRVTTAMVERVRADFARVFDMAASSIPHPLSGAVVFYDAFPSGCGWTLWRTGSHWDRVGNAMLRPVPTEDVFVASSDIAPGLLTAWVEGALTMVDRLITRYF